MIYVCVAAQNHASTVGLVLWKVRQVFQEAPREYQILVVDDASTDGTAQTLETYQGALPMVVERRESRRGFASSLERTLLMALERTDRPRRDLAVTLPADFSVSPSVVGEVARRFESGADVIVAESADGERSFGMRLVRRSAPRLLKPGLHVPGVRDLTAGACGIRLITLKKCLEEDGGGGRLLTTDGRCASAELVARASQRARQIAAVDVPPAPALEHTPTESPFAVAVSLFRAGRRLRIPPPDAAVQR